MQFRPMTLRRLELAGAATRLAASSRPAAATQFRGAS